MSAHEFLFALELSDEAQFDEMLSDLARAVLAHVGCGATAIAELTTELHRALAGGLAQGRRRCTVQFRAHAGELHLAIACDGGAEWRTTRRLP